MSCVSSPEQKFYHEIAVTLLLAALTGISCQPDRPAGPVISTWKQFTTATSGIPGNQVNAVVARTNGDKWVATTNGLGLLRNDHWQLFNQVNSPIPSDNIFCLAAGDNGEWPAKNPRALR
ncbi:MAG: hypothetical protein EOP50_13260 [Sphingobacteriales bacterium]|nr:MAG: hypothetical protein EOP50_13260 [Sphingobacteriales bacterium]